MWRLINDINVTCDLAVGSRNHTSLSKNTIFAGRHADWFARWKRHIGEVGKKQTETNNIGAGREIGKGIESCQVRGMFGIDSGKDLKKFSSSVLQLSLKLQKGLKNVFDEAILAALEPPEPAKKKRCKIL